MSQPTLADERRIAARERAEKLRRRIEAIMAFDIRKLTDRIGGFKPKHHERVTQLRRLTNEAEELLVIIDALEAEGAKP